MTLPRSAAVRLVADMPTLPLARLDLQTAAEVDRLDLGGDRTGLVWIRVAVRAGAPITVIAAEDGGQAASPANMLARLCAVRPDQRWTTRAGGSVQWTGPAARARDDAGGLAATATNDLRVVDVEGRPAVLKTYLILGSARGEGTVLAALGGGLTPRPLAQVCYRPPADGPPTCLALVTERVPGRTLDEPLRASLREAWRTGYPVLDRRTLAALTRVRSAVGEFHAVLAQRWPPSVPSDPGRAVHLRRAALRADLRVLTRVLTPNEPGRAGERAVFVAAAAAVTAAGCLDLGPAHGDLHLAHVLVDGDRIRFVDVARPEPHGSPADDGAALRRAVECMALDVLVHRAAAEQSRPAIEVVADLTAAVLGAAGYGLGRPVDVFAPLAATVPGELAATRAWAAQVCDVLDPVTADGRGRSAYLARLLHDLRYHRERGDQYHAGLAWCHLVQACSAAARLRT